MTNFKRKALCAAIGATFAVSAAPLIAAEVGNFFNAGANSKLKAGIFYSSATRDVEQDGSTHGVSISENIPEQVGERQLSGVLRFKDLDGEEDNDDIYLKISYALTPKIELYTKLGATATKLDADDGTATMTISETFTEFDEVVDFYSETETLDGLPQASDQRTDYGWLIGLGSKVILHEWASGWNLGLDGQYIYRKQDMDKNFLSGESSLNLADHDSHEIQGSLLLGKNVGDFRPYGGISYTKYKSEYDLDFNSGDLLDLIELPFSEIHGGGKLKYENEDEFGFFGGFEFNFNSATVSFELRAGDEEGVSFGLTFPL
jgi:hypothetical protein